MEAKADQPQKNQQNQPFVTFRGRRVIVRIFKNDGHRYSNWAWDIIQRGTGRHDAHYMPIDSIADARKVIVKADRFMKRREWFWWFFKLID